MYPVLVVETLNSAVHQINYFPVDKYLGSLHNRHFMGQATRTRLFARSARRGEWKNKCGVRLAWLTKRQLCRLYLGKPILRYSQDGNLSSAWISINFKLLTPV